MHCPRRAIRVERVEDGITELYQRFEVPTRTVDLIRLAIQAEVAAENADAQQQAERANRTLEKVGRERAALLRAHYDGAIPADLLKSEMDRMTRAMATAQRQAELAGKHLADVRDVLEQALTVAAHCHRQYAGAPQRVKRQINQGFFTKLWIGQDGTAERFELTEPFAVLLEQGQTDVRTSPRPARPTLTGMTEDRLTWADMTTP
ncbi:hypothetical protein BJF78_07310 [Pseudonocardia sp. CNS-139]|nr:hypothetical protein BJF78_07310 [Pseudonocardia sp. CNS-139]